MFRGALTVLALTLTLPASADQLLPQGRVTTSGDVTLGGLRIGKRAPDRARLDVSDMVVLEGGAPKPLSQLVGALPGFTASVATTGVPGLDVPVGWFVYQHPTTYSAQAAHRVQRDVPDNGGVFANTYKALWALTNTGKNTPGFEWSVTGELHNRTRASTNAEHVAVNGTAFKHAVDGGESSKTWGGNFVCEDQSGIVNPMSSCTGAEIDVFSRASGGDNNKQRVGLHVAARSLPPSTGAEFYYGFLMDVAAGDRIKRGWIMRGEYDVGLDATEATYNAAPIALAAGQRIILDGQPGVVTNRSIRVQDGAFIFDTPSGHALSIDDTGFMKTRAVGGTGIGDGILTRMASLPRDPTTTDIGPGFCTDWRNTTAATLKRVCNVDGTLRALPYQ